GHRAEEGTSRKGLDLDMPVACPEALNHGAVIPSHQGKEIQKGKRCSKGWKKVYSTGSETRGRVHPHTQKIQGVDDTTVAAKTQKAATRVLVEEKRSLLPKNIITKHPHEGWKCCRKVKVAKEDIGSQGQRGKKKCIKDPVETHNIKQRDGESTKEFVRRYKLKCRDVKGAPKCMKISEFMSGITNPELIKRLHDKIPKSVDEMIMVTTTFLRGGVAASNRKRKKSFPSWKQQKARQKPNFKKGGFRNQQRPKRKQDRFTLLTKTPKEILALDKGKHTTDECMHLKRQIEKMLKVGKLSHLIKELKQSNGKDQEKATKKEETSGKEKPLEILMEDGTDGLMIIEAEMGGHFVHCMYVDGGSSLKILYEHDFNRFRDEEHSTSAWMNFIIIRSPSPYNGIIRRPGVRRIQAVPSTAHGMLKFLVTSKMVTLRSSKIIPLECVMVSGPRVQQPVIDQVTEEKIQVAIHRKYPKQAIAIGSTLTEEVRKELYGLLRCNLDMFAWKPANMTGVPCHIAKHGLNIREGCLPVKQKKKGAST
nr:reverse transcriptase domain-containing protein [Tanacetum cinerariifolium]